MMSHWFWLGMAIACIAWYSIITLYVAIRGAGDIRGMLKSLAQKQDEDA
jgi:hypothetical protein